MSIGIDSTHASAVNMFAEIRFARRTYRQMYNENIEASTLVDMVITNPARALRLEGLNGCLAEGARANLLVIDPRHDHAHEALVAARLVDVELLTSVERSLYRSPHLEELFAISEVPHFGRRTRIEGKQKRAAGDRLLMLRELRKVIGKHKELELLPLEELQAKARKRSSAPATARARTTPSRATASHA